MTCADDLEIRSTTHAEADAYARSEWLAHNKAVGIVWDFRPGSLVAQRRGQTVGAATFHTVGGVGHLGQIVVAATATRQGIGRALYLAFERECRERGCHKLTLETAEWQAREFYEAMGYVVALEKPNDRFHGTWFLMEKWLISAADA